MSFEIDKISLRDLFFGHSTYELARYQRRYEWSRREMEQMLADLKYSYEQRRKDETAYHFFNSIILHTRADGRLVVVDGQQRLTSLYLLLLSARDVVPLEWQKRGIEAALHLPDGNVPRVVLHRGDREVLSNLARKRGSMIQLERPNRGFDEPGASRILANGCLARDWWAGFGDDERFEVANFVLDRSLFGRVTEDDESKAFQVFQTVNARGRFISAEDVLRYALIEYATEDNARQDELLRRWDANEERLGPAGMRLFVGTWRKRAQQGRLSRKALHVELIESFKSPAEALEFLESELAQDISVFAEVVDADVALEESQHKRRIDAALQSLHLARLDKSTNEWLPVATTLLERYRSEPLRLEMALVALERLVWSYYFSSDAKGLKQDRVKHFSRIMAVLSGGDNLSEAVEIMALSHEDQARMLQKLLGPIDNRWMPLRSLLVLLEMHLNGLSRRVDRESVTVEHVLPVSKHRQQWKRLFGEDQETLARYALRLGNLTLVPKPLNEKLGLNLFPTKRRILLEYGVEKDFKLVESVVENNDWSADVIEARELRLLKLACDIFGIEQPVRRSLVPRLQT